MKKTVISISFFLILSICAQAQEIKLVKYELKTPPVIGTHNGVTIHEGGNSGLHFIRGSKNEFYLITDRGPNADASEANAGKETILFPFPAYAPKIFKVRAEGDSLRILEILKLKNPTVQMPVASRIRWVWEIPAKWRGSIPTKLWRIWTNGELIVSALLSIQTATFGSGKNMARRFGASTAKPVK
jgi:hypothetical protein